MRRILWLLLIILTLSDIKAQTPWFDKFQEPMFRMPLLQGNEFHLEVAPAQKEFFNEFTTNTFGVNGNYLGPVLEFQRGDWVQMYVTNLMGEETTMHWHGLHVPAAMDGGPHGIISQGDTWLAEYEVKDQASTYWYHPHPHRMTDEQVTNGIAGMIIIRDEEESALELPRTYNVDDIPLMIQSKAFNINNGQIVPTGSETHFMVNGTIYPYVDLPRQLVRLRILNGSNLRVLYLGFSDNRTFYQIGSDGGLLPEPVELCRVSLATGERAEILVDLTDLDRLPNGNLYMVNYSREQAPGTPGTPFTNAPNVLDGRNVRFLEIRGADPTKNAISQVPEQLREPYSVWSEGEADITRYYTFQIDWLEFFTSGFLNGFTIDNQPYEHHVINHISYIDDIEIWEIYNNTPFAHPFHIHLEQFYVLDRNGEPPPANEQGRKDVVLVNGGETVRFITKFTDYTDPELAYMYHCHILSHEDAGMMGQFLVVDRLTGNDDLFLNDIAEVYPNPATDYITIDLGSSSNDLQDLFLEIHSVNGHKVIQTGEAVDGPRMIDVRTLSPGVYFINIYESGRMVGALPFEKL